MGNVKNKGPQRPNVSKYVRSVSNSFLYALEACLVNLIPLKLLIFSDVLGELISRLYIAQNIRTFKVRSQTLTQENFNHLNKIEARYKVLRINVKLSEVLLLRLYVRPFIYCLYFIC